MYVYTHGDEIKFDSLIASELNVLKLGYKGARGSVGG
jgi:hypothetical protein